VSQLSIHQEKPVLVTGATGYVASWIVKRLLEEGVTVHAAVRNPDDRDKIRHLENMASGLPGTLRFFKADLLQNGSYKEAMTGCEIVFHTASPFTLDVKDPQKELVDPAKLGTRNVLHTVNQVSSVRRVILTSSCAAIYGDNADSQHVPNGIFTERNWNTTSSLENKPYSFSKTEAEKEAWAIRSNQSRWVLAVLNPSLVLGPGINPNATSESFKIIQQMGSGKLQLGLPDIGIGVVDVRDLAEAHIKAAFLEHASGRNIISGHNVSLPRIAASLLPKFSSYPIPKRILPKALVWLFAPLVDKTITRKFVSHNVGWSWQANNTKSINALGMVYRSLETSTQDMFQQMIQNGAFAHRPAK
jgi:nucleoside-diphosphate-sugar epimerase